MIGESAMFHVKHCLKGVWQALEGVWQALEGVWRALVGAKLLVIGCLLAACFMPEKGAGPQRAPRRGCGRRPCGIDAMRQGLHTRRRLLATGK
jgi:hypothetical protein